MDIQKDHDPVLIEMMILPSSQTSLQSELVTNNQPPGFILKIFQSLGFVFCFFLAFNLSPVLKTVVWFSKAQTEKDNRLGDSREPGQVVKIWPEERTSVTRLNIQTAPSAVRLRLEGNRKEINTKTCLPLKHSQKKTLNFIQNLCLCSHLKVYIPAHHLMLTYDLFQFIFHRKVPKTLHNFYNQTSTQHSCFIAFWFQTLFVIFIWI